MILRTNYSKWYINIYNILLNNEVPVPQVDSVASHLVVYRVTLQDKCLPLYELIFKFNTAMNESKKVELILISY